jgi:hypothetical protein
LTHLSEKFGDNLKIQAYIFSWPSVHHRIPSIVRELKECSISEITIISSGEHPFSYNGVRIENIDKDAYYGEQFLAAAKMFDGDVFLQIQGDVTIKNRLNLNKHLIDIFDNHEIGIWTPKINFTSWVDEIVQLEYDYGYHYKSKILLNNSHRVILNTDSTFWAIRSSLVQEYLRTALVKSKYGWGIDLTLSSLTYANQMLAIRDKSLKVEHPRNTGYDQIHAGEEWLEMYELLDSQIKPMIWFITTLLKSKSRKYNKKIKVRITNLVYFLIQKIKLP